MSTNEINISTDNYVNSCGFKVRFLLFVRKLSGWGKLLRWCDKKIATLTGGFAYSKVIRKLYYDWYGVQIGYGTYGCIWNSVEMASSAVVGNYCSFAHDVFIFRGNHPLDNFTTHPISFNPIMGYPYRTCSVKTTVLQIGNDVWLGQNSIILPSCNEIGDGAVVAAGAVVTRDVPPYAVVGGSPAKIIKYRFTPEQIKIIQDTKWWLLDKDELSSHINDFQQIINNSKVCKIKSSSR